MTTEGSEPPGWLGKILGGGIAKSSAGIVGVLCTVAISAFVAMAAAAYALPKDWTRLVAVGLIGVIFLLFIREMLGYARSHEDAATMAGKELLEWKKKQREMAASERPPSLPPPEANVAPPAEVKKPEGDANV